jgi:glycosyltransferase involved in cell wall biosynthesis
MSSAIERGGERPLRVLHVVQGYTPAIGGTELLIQKVSEKLVSRHGDRVTVFTTTAAHNCNVFVNPLHRQLWPGTELINGVRVRRFPVFNLLGPLLFYLQRAYCRLELPRDDYARALYLGPIVLGMTSAIARHPADVVGAASFPLLHMHYAIRARRRSGVPTVLSGCMHPEEPWAFDQQMIYDSIREADGYIALTRYERDFLVGRGIDGAKIATIGVGIEPDEFAHADGRRARERYGWGDDPVVAFIGQQVGHKGVDTLIFAMPAVWRAFPNARLLIAGSRTRFSKVVRWRVSQLSPEQRQRVTIVDDFPEADKPHLFHACDVFAYPSGYESFGIAYLEAWICGKPVIGCRAGAVPSVIAEGVDGLLVPYQDEDALARAIITLLENPQLRHEMGEQGRRKALQRYTWDIVSDRFREVYVRAIAAHRSAGLH